MNIKLKALFISHSYTSEVNVDIYVRSVNFNVDLKALKINYNILTYNTNIQQLI